MPQPCFDIQLLVLPCKGGFYRQARWFHRIIYRRAPLQNSPWRRTFMAFEHFLSYVFCSCFLKVRRKRVTLDKFATRLEFRRAVRQDETLVPVDRIRIHGMRRLKAHVAKTPLFTAKVRVLRCNPAPQLPPSKAYFLSPGRVFL